jgi:hypothetical protein
MTVLGYCPGTGVVACGEGRKDAYVGLIVMFVGAAVCVYFYSNFSAIAGAWGPLVQFDEAFLVTIFVVMALPSHKRSRHRSSNSHPRRSCIASPGICWITNAMGIPWPNPIADWRNWVLPRLLSFGSQYLSLAKTIAPGCCN